MLVKPRPTGGRYPRGEETKQRVVDAAIETFGRLGYAGTSTRDIAAAAKVNTPAIPYYFGSKLGLYNACIDQLSTKAWRRIAPAVARCEASLGGGATLEEIIARLGEVQNCLIDSFFSDPEGSAIRRLLAWEDAENDENMTEQLMKERIGLPLIRIFRAVVERVVAAPLGPVELDMHALSLLGLSMIFHFNQCRVQDMLHWPIMDDELIGTLKAVAHAQLTYALVGLSGAGAARRPS